MVAVIAFVFVMIDEYDEYFLPFAFLKVSISSYPIIVTQYFEKKK